MFRRGRRAGPVPGPILDPVYLARLAAHLGHDTVLELFADGLIELADRLSEYERLARAGDTAGALRLSHDIVGVAGHLGLAPLSAAAARVNRQLRADNAVDPRPLAGALKDAGTPALAALAQAMREGGWAEPG